MLYINRLNYIFIHGRSLQCQTEKVKCNLKGGGGENKRKKHGKMNTFLK